MIQLKKQRQEVSRITSRASRTETLMEMEKVLIAYKGHLPAGRVTFMTPLVLQLVLMHGCSVVPGYRWQY